jgi:CheY-like chemotaxis protein
MDLQMPVMDGFTAARQIRETLHVKTPILALTANVLKGVIEKCMEAGMNDYVSKPFNPDEFYVKLVSLIGAESHEPVPSNETGGEILTATSNHQLVDLTSIHRILSGDQEQITRMIRKFIEITPPYMDELINAYKSNDIESVELFAHKIKSSIDLIANAEVREKIRMIHEYCKIWEQLHHLHDLIPTFKSMYDRLLVQLQEELQKRS